MPDSSTKLAQPDHPVLDVIAQRWSPYAYDPRPVEKEKVQACLEAARWSASSYNEQPWYFLLAARGDETEFKRMLGCLMDANQGWAQHAGILLLTVVSRNFSRNGKPNRVAEHDLGLAAGNLSLQATALGLAVHQMAGVNLSKVRQEYQVPEGYDPVTAIAIGYAAANPDDAPVGSEVAQRDKQARSRKKLGEFVFSGQWGESGL